MEDEGGGHIHYRDPFATPAELRSPFRRFRGALASGVTIWTAGTVEAPVGLTVSSLIVAEGEPSLTLGLVNDTTDLFEALGATGKFVVHVLGEGAGTIADRFAGLRPSPGGPFVDLELEGSDHGPAIVRFPERAYCRVAETLEAGYHRLVVARIERIEVGDPARPLIHFRGRYHKLAGPAEPP